MSKFYIHKDGYFYSGDFTEGAREATQEEIDNYFKVSKDEQLLQLDNEYQPQFLEITRAWANANMDGNTELMEQKQLEKQNLIKGYNSKREVILNG